MINQELARKWIAHMRRPEARKGKGRLTTLSYTKENGRVELDCCLGDFCKLMEVSSRVCSMETFLYYGEEKDYLPADIAIKLNITLAGTLTPEGKEFAKSFIAIQDDPEALTRWDDLTDFNDSWAGKDKDFTRMSALIEHLCDVEAKEGIECFLPFRPTGK